MNNFKIRLSSIVFLISIMILGSFCKNQTSDNEGESILMDTSLTKLVSPELKSINEKLMQDPKNPDLYYQRSRLFFRNGDLAASIKDVSKSILLDSLKADYWIFLADAHFAANQTRQSKEALEKCVQIIPSSTDAAIKLAELYFYVKKYQESITALNQALKINENLAKAYFLKGMCYKESKDTNLAISSFQTAIEQDASYFDAHMEIGMLLAYKKSSIALEYFLNALRLQPKDLTVYYNMAKFYQDAGKIELAVETYKKVVAIDPKQKESLYNLGAIELHHNKSAKSALDYFSKAIAVDPNYAEAYFARGVCFEELKDFRNARADYKMAIEIRPNFEFAIENLNLLEKNRR